WPGFARRLGSGRMASTILSRPAQGLRCRADQKVGGHVTREGAPPGSSVNETIMRSYRLILHHRTPPPASGREPQSTGIAATALRHRRVGHWPAAVLAYRAGKTGGEPRLAPSRHLGP